VNPTLTSPKIRRQQKRADLCLLGETQLISHARNEPNHRTSSRTTPNRHRGEEDRQQQRAHLSRLTLTSSGHQINRAPPSRSRSGGGQRDHRREPNLPRGRNRLRDLVGGEEREFSERLFELGCGVSEAELSFFSGEDRHDRGVSRPAGAPREGGPTDCFCLTSAWG
jgi:hypothetical protein